MTEDDRDALDNLTKAVEALTQAVKALPDGIQKALGPLTHDATVNAITALPELLRDANR